MLMNIVITILSGIALLVVAFVYTVTLEGIARKMIFDSSNNEISELAFMLLFNVLCGKYFWFIWKIIITNKRRLNNNIAGMWFFKQSKIP